MATAKPSGFKQPVSRLFIGAVIVAILLLGYWAYGAPLVKTAEAGVGYAAKGACSCRFLAGRSMDDCREDKIDGMALIFLSENADAKSVTARVPLVASDTAIFRKGAGCQLQSLSS